MTWIGTRALPNALTGARVVLTVAAYPVAYTRDTPLFAVLVLTIVLTDILDGPLARRFRVANATGANLDSAADFVFYASLPVWAFMFRPEIIRALGALVVGYFLAYLLANGLNRWRRGRIGYHNRITRTAGTFGVVVAVWLILFGEQPVLFAALVVVLSIDLVYRFLGALAAGPRGAGVAKISEE